MRRKIVSFICMECGCQYSTSQPKSRYCSTACRKMVAIKRSREQAAQRARQRYLIHERDGFRCQYCGCHQSDGVVLTLDHVVARVHGGEDTARNLTTACQNCNFGKGSRRMSVDNEHEILQIIAEKNEKSGIHPDQKFYTGGA